MADEPRSGVDRLPIKLIMRKQGVEKLVTGGGGKKEPFRSVDAEYRQRLANQVKAIRDAVMPLVEPEGAAPARVKLIHKATAKSHRPDDLFSLQTCPIVGAGRPGELFIKATTAGLERLENTISSNVSAQIVKQLSCIESIEPITPIFRRSGLTAADILRHSPRSKEGFTARIQLFNLGPDDHQDFLLKDFHATCTKSGISISSDGYSTSSMVFSAKCRTVDDIERLSKIIGVRSIAQMPLIRNVRPQATNSMKLPKLLTPADIEGEAPVVVVVDSGISDQIPELNAWIAGRESYVAPAYRNTDHGTFVAGLICWGSELNPNLAGIDNSPCGVFDLQVLPNTDPSKGDTDGLTEQEFLVALKTALQQHANKYKVWNLSLGTDAICTLDAFSQLAVELDNLQEQFQVSFVISAGNYTTVPLLGYPREHGEIGAGRITAPADSVLGITVGSISHVDYKKSGPNENHPSAFSRHGAGPNHIIKPDLVHYGGACAIDGSHITGVRSIIGSGSAENIGTSFAAPLVSRNLAHIYDQITPTPSPVLARALLTHHARDPRNGERVPDGEENFFGFGLPATTPYCIQCTPYSSTLVFEDALRPRYFLEWDDFPYPPSLKKDGRYFGEIWMTIAFAPARGPRWGSEYCETHIDAHFGVYQDVVSRSTGEVSQKFAGLVPPEHKNPGSLWESHQIQSLRKWAPVRTYHGKLNDEKGERGNRWRLKLQLLTRHGVGDIEALKPQPFALIITIADPKKTVMVYDEMAQIVLNRFQAENLAVRATARVRSTE
ncbi:MAG TPA: S8 family peptidase [Candidatus Acidoferrum sp.]|nr:S8 family peptidase [Candidatus Acidoferrum sp.]